MAENNSNTTFVLFGASGDLAFRKIYPALFQLYLKKIYCNYLGFGRTGFSNSEYRQKIKEAILKRGVSNKKDIEGFLQKFEYVKGEYDETGIKELKEKIKTEKITFYLAIPTLFSLVEKILKGIKGAGLIKKGTKIVLEKPFGIDWQSAKALDDLLTEYFDEEQIYRIDHYLAKDLVKNLFTLRFANAIFEPIWNNQFIDRIVITISETIGIEGRGAFYDQTGAIRDMIQSHALQVLAITAMSQPKSMQANSIHYAKKEVLRHIRLFNSKDFDSLEIGQYKGYRSEPNVNSKSLTETFTRLAVEINNPNWSGVPIFLVTGKKFEKHLSNIIVQFKNPLDYPLKSECPGLPPNQLVINIQPDQNIDLRLNSSIEPGKSCPTPINLNFNFSANGFVLKDAYENTLVDLFNEDRSLFLSSEEILLSWKFVDQVLEQINGNRAKILQIY